MTLDRRSFLVLSAASATGALVWGCRRRGGGDPAPVRHRELLPLVSIGSDDSVTIAVARTEMGQGVTTALPMLLAEELDCDWSRIAIENERFDPRNGDQFTAASISMFVCWEPYRRAGATARALLIAAAAKRWGKEPGELRTDAGWVIGGERRASYGSLVEEAAAMPAPAAVALDDKRPFRIIGKPLPRLDTPPKIDGSARFGIDVRVPGMLFACVARPPRPGARADRYDPEAAKRVDGVRQVVPISSGIAVLADDTWAARQGALALGVTWTGGAVFDSAGLRERLARELELPQTTIASHGDVAKALAGAGRKLSATYAFPFVPHATMEPVNATAHVERDRCTIWAPTQAPHWNRRYAAKLLGLPEDAIEVHRMLAGGGFGRKSCQDFIHDAVEASKYAGRPVQVVYTREDDLRHDYYRPAYAHRIEGAVEGGRITAWDHRLVGPSVTSDWDPFDKLPPGKIDDLSIAGAESIPYAVPNFRVAGRMVDLGVRVGIWRSIAHSYTAYVTETFLDELAAQAGADPLDFRLAHLAAAPRARRVLELAAERVGWGQRGRRAIGLGLEVQVSPEDGYGVHVAQAVELDDAPGGSFAIARVVVAADCGRIVNPNIAAAQLEGAVPWALSAMFHEITFAGGEVVQSNFHDVPILRMPQMPAVEVHLVESSDRASGMGEKGVPALAPAFANAVAAATGRRLRALPWRPDDLRRA